MPSTLYNILRQFASEASSKLALPSAGGSEDQLRAPVEQLIVEAAGLFHIKAICQGEVQIPGIGRPDFGVYLDGVLCGYVEIKQPGKGAETERYRGHDKRQWENFKALPNVLYTDGNEWALYGGGERKGALIRLGGDVETNGKMAVTEAGALALEPVLREFMTWQPVAPRDAKSLARLLAPLCRLLREEVSAQLPQEASPFRLLYNEWQHTLFPGQSEERFADAYAQTVAFALLLAQAEGGDVLDLRQAEASLAAGHALLAKTLQIFTDNLRPAEKPLALAVLQRTIAAIPQEGVKAQGKDPWLYFYEDFLSEYDPKLRQDSGSYYTPRQTVQAMVRLAAAALRDRLGMPLGFAAPEVMTLDPAAGTGTFLLGILAETLAPIEAAQGTGALPGYAEALAKQLHGFELQVSPYAVAQLLVSRALAGYGAHLPPEGPQIYLTDTLESPDITPPFPTLLTRELTEQHKKALQIKKDMPILVCIGNPPYDRHAAFNGHNRKETGGWVRWGGEQANGSYMPKTALLEDFIRPVREAGQGLQLKNLYNLYVYFWRWALWKVFEQKPDSPGLVCFITASSYLEGPAFAGMREKLRRLCHEVYIIGLDGDARGARKEDNIFDIQTPVCITLALRTGAKEPEQPAKVSYVRIKGSRAQKLAALEQVKDFTSLNWEICRSGWADFFVPERHGAYFSNPLLKDIFPWQHTGVEFKRTWPIAPDKDTLLRRWQSLSQAQDKRCFFRETPDRTIEYSKNGVSPISGLRLDTPPPEIVQYGYRVFNLEYIFADIRCTDRPRPPLWLTESHKQVYFVSKFTLPLGSGPAITLSAKIPDRDYFRGSFGAKDIMPLYRDADAVEPNILPGLLPLLAQIYGDPVSAEDFAAYVYAMLAHGGYTSRFYEELGTREIRVPLTRDAALFTRGASLGRRLIWLHSYGERMIPENEKGGIIPPGKAKCLKAVGSSPEDYPETFAYNESTGTLAVGNGEFGPVPAAIYEFEVSGLKVVQSWLKYRMKERGGRKSSPLDGIGPESWTAEYTGGLLNLLWVLEYTLALWPEQEALLDEIMGGELIPAEDLPPVQPDARKAPGCGEQNGQEELFG